MATQDAADRMEDRIRRIEDELEIRRLVSAYGPAVDSGDAAAVAALWTEDGVYDTDAALLEGRSGITAMVEGEHHQQLIANGAAHVLGAPHVVIDGDRAVVTQYSRVFRHTGDGFEPWRVAANRWELARTPEGWRATYRTVRLINGSEEARSLLRRAGTF